MDRDIYKHGISTCDVGRAQRTPFDQIAETLDAATRLADTVENLVNRLIGSFPTAGSAGVGKDGLDGLLFDYEARAARTAQRIEDAFAAITRINQVLP